VSATITLPGFADPVGQAQATFRAVLDAMARPGRLHRAGERLVAPAPLAPATAAVLLTLADNETPLWLDASAHAARDWLAFHCSAAVVDRLERATFAVSLSLPDLAALPAGSHQAPETSATLILQLPELGRGHRYRLNGPGLREPELLSASGLPTEFIPAWQRNHALYPRGVDIILCAGTTLTALPRSVSVEEG
jgi:alpha-D-ribose 1-methylphosphonate 5-triphosphate synthase subunit PhnH